MAKASRPERVSAWLGRVTAGPESIADNFASYRECFENPAEFTGDVDSI